MKDNLTIVIPCKNEGNGIIEVINLIMRNNHGISIIVCDSSDDGVTSLMLRKYSELFFPYIKIIEGGLPSVARNNGAKLVTTDYVLFIDADVHVGNYTIRDCYNEMVRGDYDLLTCKFRTDYPYRWVFRVFDIVQWYTSMTKPFAVGGFMLFKLDVFNKLGGFNEEDKIAEDYHLSSKVLPSKFKVQNNYVYTSSRRFDKKGVWYMIRLMISCWINRGNPEFYKKDYNYWS